MVSDTRKNSVRKKGAYFNRGVFEVPALADFVASVDYFSK